MNKQERIRRGEQLIKDAVFVRDLVIPPALAAQRWNIVVFECYRSAELLIKGLMLSFGHEYRKHHELHSILRTFIQRLKTDATRKDYAYRLVAAGSNDRYELRINDSNLEISGRLKAMVPSASVTLSNRDEPLYLVREGLDVVVMQNGQRILVLTDATFGTRLTPEKGIPPLNRDVQVDAAVNLLGMLRKTREQAFYREIDFEERHACSQREALEQVFELARAFYVFE